MTENDDLVKRLRRMGERVPISCPDNKAGCLVYHYRIETDPTCAEAADRIEELESWKAAEEAHHHLLRAEIARLRGALDAIRKTMDSYRSQMKFCDVEALTYFREFDRRIEQSGFRAALGETP